MLIGDCLRRNARREPERTALVFGEGRYSWGAWTAYVNQIANALIRDGVTPGSPIVTLSPNCPELAALQLACLTIGAVFVPVMPGSVLREITHIVTDVEAKYIFCAAEFVETILPINDGRRERKAVISFCRGCDADNGVAVCFNDYISGASTADPAVRVDPDSIAAIRYTSGTTGVPKGCIATQRQLANAAVMYLAQVPVCPEDRGTINSPLSAGFGIAMLHTYSCAGCTIVLLPKFTPDLLIDAIEAHKVTLAYAIETTLGALVAHPDILTRDLGSVRLFTGNSPAKNAGALFARLRQNPTFRAQFMNAYGSTEAGGSVTFNLPSDMEASLADPSLAARTESVGREGMFCRIECLDDDGNEVPAGDVGELVIASPSAFSGYWNLPAETAEVLRNGRIFTGDVAYKDRDGFVFLAGRKRDMIKSGGLNVYPAEVEKVLASHPDVIEAAIIGAPDERWGEKVVAFVASRGGARDTESIMAHCAANLAGFKRPKELHFVDALPKGPTGKILKRALRPEV